MKIGFDISQTGSAKAGCGYYAHAIIEALALAAPDNEYILYPNFGDFYFDPRMQLNNPYRGRCLTYGPRFTSREAAKEYWDAPSLESSLGEPAVIHSNNFWCPVQLEVSRLVYTFYDLGFVENPDWTTEANRVGCFEGVFRSAIAADWVVAISEASRNAYLTTFPHFPPERLRVIYPCSRFQDESAMGVRPKNLGHLKPGAFWLTVGTIEPRKNQRMLVTAFADYLKAGGAEYPLILAGGPGWLMDDFATYISALGLDRQVILTGYISDEELTWLYRNCYANLYPSLYEGFGLPVLEGMQFGAPILASNATSIPEIVSDAGILLNPLDATAWTVAMLDLARNKEARERLSRMAVSRARHFSWKESAQTLLMLYADAIASPKRCDL